MHQIDLEVEGYYAVALAFSFFNFVVTSLELVGFSNQYAVIVGDMQ